MDCVKLSGKIKRQSNEAGNNFDWKKYGFSSNQVKLVTIAKALEIGETTINVKWRLQLADYSNGSKDGQPKGKHYLPTEWTLRVRQFATLYVKLRFISQLIDTQELISTGFKDINFLVTSLNEGTAYELCLQSKEFAVIDQMDNILKRITISSQSDSIDSKMVCKEIVTLKGKCQQLTAGKIATVTVVSSASTIIIVAIVGCCWCPSSKRGSSKVEDGDDNGHEDDQDDQSEERCERISWFKWFKSNKLANDSSLNNNQINGLVYPEGKVKKWLTYWKGSKTRESRLIWFSKKNSKVDLMVKSTIYRPKSWPQDEWTIKGLTDPIGE
uniref:Uncharacterized protein n=2 Tax=Tetranychus urticae TaxID=32264 RepID=T1KFX7_TETUR